MGRHLRKLSSARLVITCQKIALRGRRRAVGRRFAMVGKGKRKFEAIATAIALRRWRLLGQQSRYRAKLLRHGLHGAIHPAR